jgi:hypothetical protein
MKNATVVQYVGFQTKGLVREYTFTVPQGACDPRTYTLTITNEAFRISRTKYQDAPQICSIKLRRELTTIANNPLVTNFCVTDAELNEYRDSQPSKLLRGIHPHGKEKNTIPG